MIEYSTAGNAMFKYTFYQLLRVVSYKIKKEDRDPVKPGPQAEVSICAELASYYLHL